MKQLFTFVLLVGLLATTGAPTRAAQPAAPLPAELSPDVLSKWMQLLYDRVLAERVNAPNGARLYAYAAVAAYQAVVPGMPIGISMAGQLNGLEPTPYPEDMEVPYDWISTANASLATVIAGLFPEDAAQTQAAVQALRENQIASRLNDIDAEIVERSTAFGDSVGEAILEWVAQDNYRETRNLAYELPTGEERLWRPTSPNQMPVEPHWGSIRPFSLYFIETCFVKPRVAYSADPASTFYLQAQEVVDVGRALTPEQVDIARYWVDSPGSSGTPAGHWVLIQNQIVDVLDLDLEMAAMMYALTNVAMADAFISSWALKYQVNLLRPITYIHEYIDPQWQPFVETPGFPEYTSGHSVVSAAAAEVLTGMFGSVAFTDRSGRRRGYAARSYTSFEAMAYEASISRLYGGIHFREAIESGMRQGRCIGRNVLDYVRLRPQPQGE